MTRTPPLSRLSRRSALLVSGAALSLLAGLPAALPSATASPAPGGHEIRPPNQQQVDDLNPKELLNGAARPATATLHVPVVRGTRVNQANGVSTRINGLTMKDQRTSNHGNSFSLEPPDQGLCVGNGYVIEAVNNVFSVYRTSGGRVSGPQSLDPFWNHGTAEIIRHSDGTATYGPFVSDPKCYFDPQLHRFFLTELQLGTDPSTGAFNGASFERIAVSKGSRPTTRSRNWHLYSLNVRNDGTQGTPSHPGCPCLGDQPLIGADRYGFYITTNEFPISGPGFNGAQMYAFDKAALARGQMKVQRIESVNPPLAEGVAYSVQPATSPTASQWSTANNGTEYFLSALQFTGLLDNRIATWAMTNTASLRTAHPNVHVSNVVMSSEVYGAPPPATQKNGPTPQATALGDPENMLQSNDDRMNQVVFADGRLWSGVNTIVQTRHDPQSVGLAYFVVSPSASSSGVTATMSHQGYLAVNQGSLLFPAIGVTPSGRAAMVFTLTGKNYFPSAAMVHLSRSGRLNSQIGVLAAGAVPADGFTGYPQYGGNGSERWGDYSAAVAGPDGKVWLATEYIPGTFGYPDFIANWGTYVASVMP
ncbi:MAG: hypothetical protein ACRDP1_12730 [Nocardioidaceae bacterium]